MIQRIRIFNGGVAKSIFLCIHFNVEGTDSYSRTESGKMGFGWHGKTIYNVRGLFIQYNISISLFKVINNHDHISIHFAPNYVHYRDVLAYKYLRYSSMIYYEYSWGKDKYKPLSCGGWHNRLTKYIRPWSLQVWFAPWLTEGNLFSWCI